MEESSEGTRMEARRAIEGWQSVRLPIPEEGTSGSSVGVVSGSWGCTGCPTSSGAPISEEMWGMNGNVDGIAPGGYSASAMDLMGAGHQSNYCPENPHLPPLLSGSLLAPIIPPSGLQGILGKPTGTVHRGTHSRVFFAPWFLLVGRKNQKTPIFILRRGLNSFQDGL